MCLGKTFAELTLKFTIPMYTYFFDFEWVDKKHYEERPIQEFGSLWTHEMKVNFITKNKI